MIIPVMTGATGIITKSLKKNSETVPGKYSIVSLQQTAKLRTPHVIRKVLKSEIRARSGADHRCFRSTRKKRPVTIDNNNRIIIIIISLSSSSSSLPSGRESRNCAD